MAKPRHCTGCNAEMFKEDILFTSPYPEEIETRTGSKRRGSSWDAERIYCKRECAQKVYVDLVELGIIGVPPRTDNSNLPEGVFLLPYVHDCPLCQEFIDVGEQARRRDDDSYVHLSCYTSLKRHGIVR